MQPLLATLEPSHLPLLITGISGVAGYAAFFHFRSRFPGQVVGVRPTATFRLAGADVVGLDTEDQAGMEGLFRRHRFRSVLNTTGSCALKSCELDPAMAQRTNVTSARHIARSARRHQARLVHLSTDLVYSGTGPGGHVETDPVDPVTVYGKTMAQAEAVVHHLDPGAAILRMSLPMGPSFNGHAGAIDWIQSRFRKNRPATLYLDEVRSSTYVADLCRVFEHFLAVPVAGLFHLGGPRPLSLYQIAQVINRVGGYDPHLLHGIPRHQAGPIPPRAGNVSMNSAKLLGLLGGNPFRPWPLGDDIVPDHPLWHHERPGHQPAGLEAIHSRLYHYPEAGESGARQATA